MVTPHLEQPKCLPASSQHLTASTSLPLSTDLQEVYFIPRPRNKALAAVENQNQYIYSDGPKLRISPLFPNVLTQNLEYGHNGASVYNLRISPQALSYSF